jgi:hypothetical protein
MENINIPINTNTKLNLKKLDLNSINLKNTYKNDSSNPNSDNNMNTGNKINATTSKNNLKTSNDKEVLLIKMICIIIKYLDILIKLNDQRLRELYGVLFS